MNNIKKKLSMHIERKDQISCITCYDASFCKILSESNVDIVLVGDSLGMVIKGEENTHNVKIDEILYHTKCVSAHKKNFILMVDMPINSYSNPEISVLNAKKILDTNADIIKIEYKDEHRNVVENFISKNIPVCAHLGYLPQFANKKEDTRIYGKDEAEHNQIFTQAKTLENIGVDIILLECVDSNLSKLITDSLNIPVIGIGSGENCNGQVQVLYDIIGISKNPPRFAKDYLKDSNSVAEAINKFCNYVKEIKY